MLVIPLIGISTPSVCCLFFLWLHVGDSIDRDINTLCLLFFFFLWLLVGDSIDRDINTLCLLFVFFVASCW